MPAPATIIRSTSTAPLESTLVDISVDDDLTPAFDLRAAAFGGLIVPATVNGTSLSFLVSDDREGTFVPLNDADGSNIVLTIASATAGAVALPPELFAFNWAKVVCATAQTTTNTQFIVTLRG